MKRGEVWIGNLNRGREPGKIRPVLVMQSNAVISSTIETLVILPLTRQIWHSAQNWRVRIPARERLTSESFVIVDKPRSLDRDRFGEGPLTTLTPAEMAKVEKVFLALVGLL